MVVTNIGQIYELMGALVGSSSPYTLWTPEPPVTDDRYKLCALGIVIDWLYPLCWDVAFTEWGPCTKPRGHDDSHEGRDGGRWL